MPKLTDSYVEFFAKGLEEVEAQTKELTESSSNAHKAVDILSAKFKDLYDKTLKKGIISVDTLFDHQRKIDNLFKKNEGMKKFIVDQEKVEKLQEVFNKTLEIEIVKLKALDKEFLALSVAEQKLTEKANQANKSLGLQVRAELLAIGTTKELMKAEIKLQAQEGALILQEKKLAATLIETDVEYRKHAIQIQKTSQAEKILALESQVLMNNLMATDQAFAEMTATEIKLNQSLDLSSKALQLKARLLSIVDGNTEQYIAKSKELAEEEAGLVKWESQLNLQLMKTDAAFIASARSIAKAEESTKNNTIAIELEIAKIKELDAGFIQLTADGINLSRALDASNKGLSLNAKAAMLANGDAEKYLKTVQQLSVMEAELNKQESQLFASLIKTDSAFKAQAMDIAKANEETKNFNTSVELEIAIAKQLDSTFVQLTADGMKMAQELSNSNRELANQAKQFLISSGAAEEFLKQEKDLANFESILAKSHSDIQTQLMKTDDLYRQQALSIEKNSMEMKNNQAAQDLEMMKMKKLDGSVNDLTAGFMMMADEMQILDEQMNLQAKTTMLESGYIAKSLQAHLELAVGKAELGKKTQELTTDLIQNSDAYRDQVLKLELLNQATKNSKIESDLSIAKMREQDNELANLMSTESNLQRSIDQSTKALQLKTKALSLASGATQMATTEDKKLQAEESAINNGIAKLENSLLKNNATYRNHTLGIEKDRIAGKTLADENTRLIAKMMATDQQTIKNTADSMAHTKATDAATKRLELQARQLNVNSGAFKAQTKEADALAKMEAKVAKQEEKIQARAKSGMFGVMFSKKSPKGDQPAKIAIDSSSGPAAEKFMDRMMGKLGKLQTLALVAGGAIGGYVASFTAAASANTLEAERLGQAYEYAGRIVGDMFAPYVRLTTDLINKFSAYWKTLSSELKSSIAMWSMVGAGIATLVASLPILISIVGAVLGAFAALLSPIALVGMALVGIGVYLSGVAEAGITMEKRITRAVRAVLDVFSLVQTVAETIWETLGPVFQDIVDGATTAFNWILKQLGFVGEDGEKTGTLLGSAFSKAMLNCMEYFNKFKTFVFGIIQAITSTWKSFTDNFALGLAAIAETAGIVPQGTSQNLAQMNAEERKKFDAEQKKAMEEMKKRNEEAMNKLRDRLNENKDKADEIAGPLIKMFKGLQTGKGFQMKMNVSFEGLQGTFDRLQQSFAQQVGPNIEQAQLGQLQGIHNNMQIAASALVNIKDKVPAVR